MHESIFMWGQKAPKQCAILSLYNSNYRAQYITLFDKISNHTKAWEKLPETAFVECSVGHLFAYKPQGSIFDTIFHQLSVSVVQVG